MWLMVESSLLFYRLRISGPLLCNCRRAVLFVERQPVVHFKASRSQTGVSQQRRRRRVHGATDIFHRGTSMTYYLGGMNSRARLRWQSVRMPGSVSATAICAIDSSHLLLPIYVTTTLSTSSICYLFPFILPLPGPRRT